MASIGTEIVITLERRLCFVGDKRASFHRWIDKETPMVKINARMQYSDAKYFAHNFLTDNVIPCDCEVIMQKITLGLVEYEDGTVAEVEPTSIRFDVEREREV